MEELLAICVGGLLGVTAAHPPPGTGQPQSQGTSSTPPAPLPHLLLHSMPLQLGEGKESRAEVGTGLWWLSWAANPAGLPSAGTEMCTGNPLLPVLGSVVLELNPSARGPGPLSPRGCGWPWSRGWSPALPGSFYLSTCL